MVFPSAREGMPVCVMEAISMGIPVIGCDQRGIREIVEHKINGFIANRCTEGILLSMQSLLAMTETKSSSTLWAKEKRDEFSRSNFFSAILYEIERYIGADNLVQ